VDVVVIDADENPMQDIGIEIVNAGGQALRTLTDPDGVACFDGVNEDTVQLGLYEVSGDLWTLLDSKAIESRSSGAAQWQTYDAAASAQTTHTVVDGDTITSLAALYGMSADALWAQNTALQATRKNKNMLAAGDEVAIPAKTTRREEVAAGQRHRVQIQRPSMTLNIRFLENDETPRAGLSYLVSVETASGDPVEDRTGWTDDDGFVIEELPVDATIATVTLGPDCEVHQFRVGGLDPSDTIRGLQDRLHNLEYDCGDEDGELGPLTVAAMQQFQRDTRIPVTEKPDDVTWTKLLELHLS
jgi:hypothetical protein